MQIHVDKKTGSLIAVIIALLAIVGALAIQNNNSSMSGGHTGHDMRNSTDSKLASADIMFLQMMIPHHQQAIDMSEIAATNSQNPELLGFAKNIATAQGAEIVMMKNWLAKAGASPDMGQMDHGMSGMLSDDDLKELQSSNGKEFEQLWLKGMSGHHEGAIDMVDMIKNTENAEIKAFGLKIIADQSAQIEQIKRMLSQLENYDFGAVSVG